MTDTMTNGEQQGQAPSGDNLRELRDKADKASRLERENTLLKAGVPVDTDLGAMFAKGYDGPLEVDAVKEAWGKIAPAAPPPAPPEPKAEDGILTPEQAAEAQRQEAEQQTQDTVRGAIGSTPPDPTGRDGHQDPVANAWAERQALLKDGKSPEEADKVVIGAIVQAAEAGDERYLTRPWTAEELGQT